MDGALVGAGSLWLWYLIFLEHFQQLSGCNTALEFLDEVQK
jgi:hypothetical protein